MIEIKPHFRLPPPTSSSAYNLVVAKQKTFQTDDKVQPTETFSPSTLVMKQTMDPTLVMKITNNGIDPSKFKVFKFYEKIKFKKIDQSVPSIVTVSEVKDKFDPTIPERQNQINEKAILSATITKKLSEKNGKLLVKKADRRQNYHYFNSRYRYVINPLPIPSYLIVRNY
ncbi:hypothetical protein QR98_0024450 [Sarcoptes scabiei]|uniref:Uncharacterized protein n=1 Tax=Sarcoptes scabiei TaxID=52283 RepID=A0A131ZYW9_SARSC|nr:hypothetical protein QR98_0024450 [Sarcoptes scabiei]